jgi:hypothetical protein
MGCACFMLRERKLITRIKMQELVIRVRIINLMNIAVDLKIKEFRLDLEAAGIGHLAAT